MPSEGMQQENAKVSRVSNDPASPSQAWLHARARLMPDLLAKSPLWVRSVFDHSWAPMRALSHQVAQLPPLLWSQLLRWDSGYVVVCTGDSHYSPGPYSIRRQVLTNVAFVSVKDLAVDSEQPLHVLGHLIDHHLGCSGDITGPWLSEGSGVSPHWRRAGEHLSDLFALGYGVDSIAQASVRDYFAQSLAIYCRDRQRLNIADPQIYKWFRSVLWDEASWKGLV